MQVGRVVGDDSVPEEEGDEIDQVVPRQRPLVHALDAQPQVPLQRNV